MKILKALENKSNIAFGVLGVCGVLVSVGLAIHDTLVYKQKRDEEIKRREEEDKDEMTLAEEVILGAECYAGTIISTTTTVGCVAASVITGEKKIMALSTACQVTGGMLGKYKEAIAKVLPQEEVDKVKEELAKKTSAPSEPSKITSDYCEIISTGLGEDLCRDPWSGRLFRCSPTVIKDAVDKIYKRMVIESECVLNDFYDEINLPHTESGKILGWDISRGTLEADFDSVYDEILGKSVTVIGFTLYPLPLNRY